MLTKIVGVGGRGYGSSVPLSLKIFSFFGVFSIPGFEKMDTKEQGYWKDFSEAILDLTRPQKKFDLLWAFQSLNRAILDLYEVVDLPYPRKKKVEFYSGYVIHYIVLIDAIKGPEFKLSYQQEDIQDPYDKSCLIRMAKQITGLFMDHQSMTYGGFFLDNTPNFYCSTDTECFLLNKYVFFERKTVPTLLLTILNTLSTKRSNRNEKYSR